MRGLHSGGTRSSKCVIPVTGCRHCGQRQFVARQMPQETDADETEPTCYEDMLHLFTCHGLLCQSSHLPSGLPRRDCRSSLDITEFIGRDATWKTKDGMGSSCSFTSLSSCQHPANVAGETVPGGSTTGHGMNQTRKVMFALEVMSTSPRLFS